MGGNVDKNLEGESSGSSLGDDQKRNELLEEHSKKYPEGDPSVRRKNPDKGSLK